MAGEWQSKTLGDCVQFVSGGTPSKARDDFWNGDVPWVSAKDMKSWWLESTEDKLTELGAEQATWIAPIGTPLILVRGMTLHKEVPLVRVRKPSAFNQDVKAVVPKQGIHASYVPYLLAGLRDVLLSKVDSAGHGTGRLPTDILTSIEVSVPDVREQESISELLSIIDDKIDLNRQISVTLEDTARALFKSWFTDFEPVHAKAANGDPGLPCEFADLFPDSFNDDGLPTEWTQSTVGELFSIVAGNTPSTTRAEYWGGAHAWATPKDMSGLPGPLLTRTDRTLSDEGFDICSSGQIPEMSLLMSSRAPVGYLALNTLPLSINQGIAAFVAKKLSTYYAWAWCHENMGLIKANANGSTFQEISKGVLRSIPMVKPSKQVHAAFVGMMEAIFAQIVELSNETASSVDLKNELLPKLMSGELRVADAKNAVAAA